jgi:hypothetical protein
MNYEGRSGQHLCALLGDGVSSDSAFAVIKSVNIRACPPQAGKHPWLKLCAAFQLRPRLA